jgi:hypothetical protein
MPLPIAVSAVWLPGVEATPCVASITHGSEAFARVLATDIDRAPEVTPGTYMCTIAKGSQVNLYFSYGFGRPDELVNVALSGCSWIFAPGRDARWFTGPGTSPSFRSTLAKIVPSTGLQYFTRR